MSSTSSKPNDLGRPILGSAFNRLALADRTLDKILNCAADRYGDRHFASLPGGDLSFAQGPRSAAEVAGALHVLGLRAGDRVALLLSNRIEFVSALWGTAWGGAIAVPVNPELKLARLEYVLNHTQAEILVTDSSRLGAIEAVWPSLTSLRHIILIDDVDQVPWAGATFHGWSEIVGMAPPRAAARVNFGTPVMILYTSGTTGPPKGVVVSHHQYYCYAAPNVDNLGWGPGDHLFSAMPLFHAQAHLAVLVPGLMAGSRLTIREKFSARGFWPDVAQCGATHVSMVGAAVNILMNQPFNPAERQHRLRTVVSAPPPIDIAAFEERFDVRLLWQGYGMTEGNFNHRILSQAEKPRNCVGRPSPLFDLRIFDEQDREQPQDGTTIGEIVVRPLQPNTMMTEYWRDPTATAAAFRNLWFHTGDLGTIDPEGFVCLHGRNTDSIRHRGENISAVEIEQDVLTHPIVAMAAAYGVPSELSEDDVKLDVVLKEAGVLTPPELFRYLEARLPAFMLPRYIQVRDAFPLTASMRVEKYKLIAEGTAAAVEVK